MQNEPFHGGNSSQEHIHLPNSSAFCLLSFIVPASQVPAWEISAASLTVADFTCLGYFKFLCTSNCLWILYKWQNVHIITPHHSQIGHFHSATSQIPPGPPRTHSHLLGVQLWNSAEEFLWECKKVFQRKEILLQQSQKTIYPCSYLQQENTSPIYCCQFSLPGLNSPIFP